MTREGAAVRKTEVEINGETVEVIAREEAERIILETPPEELVETAWRAGNGDHHGFAALDLETGEIRGTHLPVGSSFRPGPSALVLLWGVEASRHEEFEPETIVEHILTDVEAEEALALATRKASAEGYDPPEGVLDLGSEDAEAYLRSTGESYDERLVNEYLHHHGEDPDPRDVLAETQTYLGEVYDPA